MRACGSARVCVRTRACAGLREWGTGARAPAGRGLGRLPQPSVPGSATLSGIPAATLARDAKSEHTTAPPRALSASGPAFGSRVPGLPVGAWGWSPPQYRVPRSNLTPGNTEIRRPWLMTRVTLAWKHWPAKTAVCVLDPHLGRPATVVLRFSRIGRQSRKSATQEEMFSATQS